MIKKFTIKLSNPHWERDIAKMNKSLFKFIGKSKDISPEWMLIILIAVITLVGGIVKLFIQ